MTFARPEWLVLLILLPLLGAGALAVARLRKKQWAEFVAPRLRPFLLKRSSPLPRWFSLAFLFAACAAMIVALSRPCADGGSRGEKSIGRNVIIALDLSRSMRVADVKPDRLAQAKIVIYELLDALPNERIGLIGFAGDAYELAPLTIDHAAVRETIQQVDETWAPYGGSNLGEAVDLATKSLKKTGQKNNALVIISDGDENDGQLGDMIREAAQSGVYIIAIGVGTENGDFVPNRDFAGGRMIGPSGKPVISRLQPDVLRKLANETKGHFAVAGSGADIPGLVKSVVRDLDAYEIEGRERKITIEFYQWLLLPAILLLGAAITAGTRWAGVGNPVLPLAALFLLTDISRADPAADAKNALANHRYAEAAKAYRNLAESSLGKPSKPAYLLGAATASYHAGDYASARGAYSLALHGGQGAVLTESHLGMGATLFQQGWQQLAGSRYPGGKNAPELKEFDDLVRKTLENERNNQDKEEINGDSSTKRWENLVLLWTDAIRHFDSALQSHPGHPQAAHNKSVTTTYLKRLRELLEEERQETENSLPPPPTPAPSPQDGDPPPDEGGGENPPPDPKDGKDGKTPDKGDKNPQDGNQQEKPPKDGDSGKPEENDKKPGDNPSGDGKKSDTPPGETPEQQAKRILKENSDLEKGPLTPGKRLLRNPEKDW